MDELPVALEREIKMKTFNDLKPNRETTSSNAANEMNWEVQRPLMVVERQAASRQPEVDPQMLMAGVPPSQQVEVLPSQQVGALSSQQQGVLPLQLEVDLQKVGRLSQPEVDRPTPQQVAQAGQLSLLED